MLGHGAKKLMPTVGEIIRRLTPKGTLLQADFVVGKPASTDPIGNWRDSNGHLPPKRNTKLLSR